MTFSRRGSDNAAVGYAYIRVEKDVERFSALVEALTDEEPGVYRMKDGTIMIACGEGASGGLRRARKRHSEVAGGDGPPVGRLRRFAHASELSRVCSLGSGPWTGERPSSLSP